MPLSYLLVCLLVVLGGVGSAIFLIFRSAPYGRHGRAGWGPDASARIAWLLMEAPAVWGFAAVYSQGGQARDAVPLLLLGLWMLHYLERGLIGPLRLRSSARIPLVVVGAGVTFQSLNAWLNARWISHIGDYSTDWLSDPRFILGVLVFGAGYLLNRHSDRVLRRLRAPGETGYKIPHRGAHRWVSAPNYLGEIVQWLGWALLAWSPGGLAFALFTILNLAPRAKSHQRWYRETFEDYPAERKALIPRLW